MRGERERERVPALRLGALRDFAVLVERFAAARFGAALLPEVEEAADFARVVPALGFARVAAFLGAALRAVLPDELVLGPVLDVELASAVHFPLITRCAASATASAMIAPSLVALDTTLLAACEAVSAASSPASRILRRAAGLALIAAAAAASPAASISLLIAALANLSTVLLPDFDAELREEAPVDDVLDADREDVFRGVLAILSLPASREKTLSACNGSQTMP